MSSEKGGRFANKVAIITGASTGLGPVMARMLAAQGASLVLAAREVGEFGIRCNCVVPGAIGTDLMVNYMKRVATEQGRTYEEVEAGIVAPLPLKTFSTPEDIANMALFLASDEARTITGQSINVDAGLVMS